MEESERTELMRGIASDIEMLSTHLKKKERWDYKLAFECVNLYRVTFGDEGLSYLENKFDKMIMRYEFDKPDKIGLQEIENFLDKVETPKIFKTRPHSDETAFDFFIEIEKDKIAAFTNGQTPPLERRNFNSKENFMSDEFEEQGEQELSPKLKAFREAVQHAGIQRKVIADAIKAGTLCCLPGTDGYADTKPAFNILNPNGKLYHGSNLLYLKEFQQKNDFPTCEYITYQQIENAKKDNPNLFIREGQKGISIHVNEKIGVNEWEDKHIRLFNVAQVSNPEKLKNWATQQLEEAEKKDLEWKKTHYSPSYEAPAPKQKEPGPEIVCSSTEPEKYLGQYFAAVSMGSKFKVSPEQAAEFSQKMVDALYKKLEPTISDEGEIKEPPKNKLTGEPITDVFSLEKISKEANIICKEFIRDLKIEAQKQNQPEQKQEQKQGFKR